MKLHNLLTLALLTLSACGSDTAAVAGHWSQETGSEKHGMTLEFDAKSDKLMVHTAPDENGGHDHVNGTYTFDAKASSLTVKCELVGKGKGDTWQGKVDGEHMTLTGGAVTLKFHKGEDPHAHEHK